MDLKVLENELNNCSQCYLRKDCKSPVGWFGNAESPIVLVGEGPGRVEDDYVCPLIGASGRMTMQRP